MELKVADVVFVDIPNARKAGERNREQHQLLDPMGRRAGSHCRVSDCWGGSQECCYDDEKDG